MAGLIGTTGGKSSSTGEEIQGSRPDVIVHSGLVHVAQDRALFGDLQVWENLEMGAYTQPRSSIKGSLDEVFDLFPILAARRKQVAKTMSGGQQQMLAIGRALMARPRCLTLDEPSVGLAPNLVPRCSRRSRRIRDAGVTVLIVEQNASRRSRSLTAPMSSRMARSCWRAPVRSCTDDSRVREAYLGM